MLRRLAAVSLMAVVSTVIAADLPKDKLDNTGFETIFDGKTLKGWHVSAMTGHSRASMNKTGGKWEVVDGAITGTQDIPGNGGIVLSDKSYGDFEVIVEMKNDFGPDSGLFLRSNEKGQAYQYMVDYHNDGNLAGIYGEGLPGGLHLRNFDFGKTNDPSVIIVKADAATKCPVTPEQWKELWKHGEWNELRARIAGNPPKITTWINGVKFTELQDTEKRTADTGMIALQVHGGGDYTKQFVRYKGIKIKELKK